MRLRTFTTAALTLLVVSFSFLTGEALAQSRTNQITRPCAGSTTPAKVSIAVGGNIVVTPCSGGTSTITGLTASTATLASPTFTGTLTGPRWTASQGTLTDSAPFVNHTATWNDGSKTFTNILSNVTDTASAAGSLLLGLQVGGVTQFSVGKGGSLSSGAGGTFPFSYTATSGSGIFSVGQANIARLVATQSTGNVTLTAGTSLTLNSRAGTTTIGDTELINNGTSVIVDDTVSAVTLATSSAAFSINVTGTYNFGQGSSAGIFDLDQIQNYQYFRTVTAAGTTGARTISRPVGTVNFAAGTAAITVTNTTVTTSSVIFATMRTNDATCAVKSVVPGAGSFVINMTANCTAETSVGFLVTN